MIGLLEGQVVQRSFDNIVLMVHGVGYEVYLAPRAMEQITNDQALTLQIYTHVREDILSLYGFATVAEKALFILLLQVQGIGVKTAQLIVDRGVDQTQKAIVNADVSFFTTIPRVGKKNAQKIIIELKNKVGSMVELDLSEHEIGGEVQDILVALENMGLSKNEAVKMVRTLPDNLQTTEAKIRYIISQLGEKAK